MRTSSTVPDGEVSAARQGPQSVGRVLAIMERLADARDGASLAELALLTGTPKSSLSGLLQGLVVENCVSRDSGGRYRIGDRFLSLATRTVFGQDIVAALRPVLADLAFVTGETALLAALAQDGAHLTYLDAVESENPIRYSVRVGELRELHCTAAGKVLLAHMPEPDLQAWLERAGLPKFTARTISTMPDLRRTLDQVREVGVAFSADERVLGASAIAAPVFGPDGQVMAALLIAGPTARMADARDENERALRSAAARCDRR